MIILMVLVLLSWPDMRVRGQIREDPLPRNATTSTTSTTPTTTLKISRTTPKRPVFEPGYDYCLHIAYYCLKAYRTGKVCASALYFQHQEFENYCEVDFANCRARYEVWQVIMMGPCKHLAHLSPPVIETSASHDDFLDKEYVWY